MRSKEKSALTIPAALAVAVLSQPAAAATPTLMWTGVERVAVQCLVQGVRGNDAALAAELCERVRRLASRAAPTPVGIATTGDPVIGRAGTVALLVHATVQPAQTGRMLVFSLRPYRAAGDGSEVLFGAAPRAALIPASGTSGAALTTALNAALSEVLPWQRRLQGSRRISASN